MQCWIFELLLNFHARFVKNLVFERFELHPAVSFDTILNLHSDLGTKHSLINRLITIIHENGEKGPHCIFTQRMSNTIQDHASIMNDKAIQIPKEVI